MYCAGFDEHNEECVYCDCSPWFIVALYLYPLDARLYSQLLHCSPGMGDIIGAVSLRRHPGQRNTAMEKKKNDRLREV